MHKTRDKFILIPYFHGIKQFSVASVIGFHDSRRDEMQEIYYCHSPQNSDEIKQNKRDGINQSNRDLLCH